LAVSVVVALSVCGLAVGAGLGIQRIALPAPPGADRVAADAAAWLLRYRITQASIRLGGRHGSSLCLHSWFPGQDGELSKGVMLVLADGTRILENGGIRVWHPLHVRPWSHLKFLLELAGCPTSIGDPLATAAAKQEIILARSFAFEQPALALQLPTQRVPVNGKQLLKKRLTLYVSARTYRPLAVIASLGALDGTARLRLMRATPRLLAHFRLTLDLQAKT
jgi:hypothetical protein